MTDEPRLFQYILGRKWAEAIKLARSQPFVARHTNSQGRTALHSACDQDPPVEVVSALLIAFPPAASKQDNCGWTPLHDACNNSSGPVVKQLLDFNIASINVKDKVQRTPLSYLCNRYRDKINEALNRTLLPDQIPSNLLDQDVDLKRFWSKACLLVKAAYHGSVEDPLPNGKIWHMLHACTGVNSRPSNLFQLALKLHPEQLQECDHEGNLPLHIAALAPLEEKDNGLNIIEKLITANPDASKVRNHQRELPLHLAAWSGKPWEGGTKAILEAFPSAITTRDEGTLLFPFMLAAIGHGSLGSVFLLLRSCPELERFSSQHDGLLLEHWCKVWAKKRRY